MITFLQRWMLAILLLGCGGEGPEAVAVATAAAQLLPLPEPDLSAADTQIRDRVGELESAIEQLETKTIDPSALGDAHGALGQFYLAHHFVDAAQVCLRNAQTMAPEDHRWPYLLGFLYQIQGQMEQASQAFQRVLTLGEADQGARLRLATVYLELGQIERAQPLVEQVMESEPSSAFALDAMAKIALAEKDPERAVELFERALEVQPEASSVHYSLAQAYRKLGNLERAREHLQQSGDVPLLFPEPVLQELARFGVTTEFYRLRAERAFETGKFAIAAENYRQLVARDPDRFDDRKLLAYSLHRAGDLEGSLAQLEASLQIRDPAVTGQDRAQIHRLIAGLQVQLGADPKAIDHLRMAVGMDSENAEGHLQLGDTLARSGLLAEAVAQYTALLAIQPRNADALSKRGTALINLGQGEEGLSDLRSAVAVEPGNDRLREHLASALEHLGGDQAPPREQAADGTPALETTALKTTRALAQLANSQRRESRYQEAADNYRKALELTPEAVEIRLNLADLLNDIGRPEEAAIHYSQIVARDPAHREANLGVITALLLQTRYVEAKQHIDRAIQVIPDSGALLHLLARLLAIAPEDEIRDGRRSLELALAIYDDRGSPDHAETVAMAYAELGQFDQAVEWQRRVIAQAAATARPRALERWREQLESYRQRRPWRAHSAAGFFKPDG